MAELALRANGLGRHRHGADGVGRGLMELDPFFAGGGQVVLDSQLQADPSPTAESRCDSRLNGLPKPVVFFRPPARRNIGVAY